MLKGTRNSPTSSEYRCSCFSGWRHSLFLLKVSVFHMLRLEKLGPLNLPVHQSLQLVSVCPILSSLCLDPWSLVKILVLDSLGIVSSKVQIIYNAPQKWFPRCLKCPFCPEIQSSWKLEAIIIDLNVYFLKKMNLNKIANCQIVFIRWCFGIDSRRPTRKDSKLCMFLFGF